MLPGKVNKSRIKRLSGVGVGRVLFVKAVFPLCGTSMARTEKEYD